MDYRVSLTLAVPTLSDSAALAEVLDRTTDALARVAPTAGVVVDAKVGDLGVHVTLTVDAPDITEAVNQATRLLGTALLPLSNIAVEPVAEPVRAAG